MKRSPRKSSPETAAPARKHRKATGAEVVPEASTPARAVRRTRASGMAPSQAGGDPPEAAEATLEARLGYRFANPQLLELALTHSSFIYEARLGRAKTNHDEPNQPGTDNEQLEFLGDAVLGLAVTELLLGEFPARSEGELTRIRASLVSRKRMAELGETLALGDLLHLGKSAEAGEGRRKAAVLANSTEALLGAMYLDVVRGADARTRTAERALRVVREVLQRLLVEPDLPAIREELAASPGRGAMRDPKSRLQERVQAEHAGRLLYADVDESGPAHARLFTVEARLELPDGSVRTLARAEGGSKKEAQQTAAGQAMLLPSLHGGLLPGADERPREPVPARAEREHRPS